MNTLPAFASTQQSLPSPDGQLIATIDRSALIIRSSQNCEKVLTFPLPTGFTSQCRYLRWSNRRDTAAEDAELSRSENGLVQRILIASEDTVRILGPTQPEWHAEIRGADSNIGKIANVDFGYTSNEVVVFSDFGIKVTVWSLVTSRGVEIKDPKFVKKGYGFRPRTGHLAVIIRETVHDLLMLLAPGTHELVKAISLATVDAQDLQWSPDSRWLAIWDSTSSGYKVLIYTADGNLFRTFSGGQDIDSVGLGVRTVGWSPKADFLAVGDYDDRVTLLIKNTFIPLVRFSHSTTLNVSEGAIVWQEQINAFKERSYVVAPHSACPPAQSSQSSKDTPKTGISIMSFNYDGTLLASKSEFTPTTVWIWSPKFSNAVAVLIHHSPVRKLEWHPTIPSMLLIHCTSEDPIIHLWDAAWEVPRVFVMQLERLGGKMEVSWLYTNVEYDPALLFGNAHNCLVGQVLDGGEGFIQSPEKSMIAGHGTEDMFDEGNSLDFSPVKHPLEGLADGNQDDAFNEALPSSGSCSDDVDDTFHYRRHGNA